VHRRPGAENVGGGRRGATSRRTWKGRGIHHNLLRLGGDCVWCT
jgi:hypothetical protein